MSLLSLLTNLKLLSYWP